MNLKDPTSSELILRIALRQQPLASLTIADHFLSRANLPPVLQVSNHQILLVQNRQLLRRKMANKLAKINTQTQYYRCQGYGHFASQCPSQIKTLLVKVPIEDVGEDSLYVALHLQDNDLDASTE